MGTGSQGVASAWRGVNRAWRGRGVAGVVLRNPLSEMASWLVSEPNKQHRTVSYMPQRCVCYSTSCACGASAGHLALSELTCKTAASLTPSTALESTSSPTRHLPRPRPPTTLTVPQLPPLGWRAQVAGVVILVVVLVVIRR